MISFTLGTTPADNMTSFSNTARPDPSLMWSNSSPFCRSWLFHFIFVFFSRNRQICFLFCLPVKQLPHTCVYSRLLLSPCPMIQPRAPPCLLRPGRSQSGTIHFSVDFEGSKINSGMIHCLTVKLKSTLPSWPIVDEINGFQPIKSGVRIWSLPLNIELIPKK